MSGFFYPPLQPAAPADPNLKQREFQGDGTPYLRTPGLKRLESVRLGGMREPLPLERVTEIPVAVAGEQIRTIEARFPTVALERDAEGEAYLMRATFSNDGLWQKSPVFVVGEFEDDEPEATPAEGSEGAPRKPGRAGKDW